MGRRIALIVAVDAYADPGLRQLRAPSLDADALADVLGDPDIGGFEVSTLINATQSEMAEAVEAHFDEAATGDFLLLHMSCHGVKSPDGELFFAAQNTKINRLGSTGLASSFVSAQMARSRSRQKVLFLDCCYSGAFERGLRARAGEDINVTGQFERRLAGRGSAVITASSAQEYAFEGVDLADQGAVLGTSVFTTALVKGLRTGDADLDGDGLVSLDDLYDYVFDQVRQVTADQTPSKSILGLQGRVFVAKRVGGIKISPLPVEVQQAIDSPLPAVRNVAIDLLETVLRDVRRSVSLPAREALVRLVQDDSRTVSEHAQRVLDAAPGDTDAPPAEPVSLASEPVAALPEREVADEEAALPPALAPTSTVEPAVKMAPAFTRPSVGRRLLENPVTMAAAVLAVLACVTPWGQGPDGKSAPFLTGLYSQYRYLGGSESSVLDAISGGLGFLLALLPAAFVVAGLFLPKRFTTPVRIVSAGLALADLVALFLLVISLPVALAGWKAPGAWLAILSFHLVLLGSVLSSQRHLTVFDAVRGRSPRSRLIVILLVIGTAVVVAISACLSSWGRYNGDILPVGDYTGSGDTDAVLRFFFGWPVYVTILVPVLLGVAAVARRPSAVLRRSAAVVAVVSAIFCFVAGQRLSEYVFTFSQPGIWLALGAFEAVVVLWILLRSSRADV